MGLNAYRGGKGNDKQFWMSVNSGSPVKSDRKGNRNEPQVIPRPCVGIIGPLTPSNLPTIRDNGADDGWLDRIIFSYPDEVAIPDWTEDGVPQEFADEWATAIRRLWVRPMVHEDGRDRAFVVNFTSQAKPLWVSWFNSHVAERRHTEFPRSLKGPWSKLEGFCGRFALILSQLHQAYDPTSTMARPSDVDALAMIGAAKLASYFKSHFKRAKAELSGRPLFVNDCAEAVLRWLRLQLSDSVNEFSERDISRRFHRYEKTEQDEALRWMCGHGVIRQLPGEPRKPGEMGRPKTPRYEINPFLEPLAEVAEVAKVDSEPDLDHSDSAVKKWLRSYLLTGWAFALELVQHGREAGYAEVELRNAMMEASVESTMHEGRETWHLMT